MRIGIIGGSGLGDVLGAEKGCTEFPATPFGKPSSPIVLADWKGVEIAILQRHGPGHVFNPSRVPYRANIFALKSLGVTHIVASGATGSLREGIHPGDLVIADQVIDKTFKRDNTFYDGAAVHVEFSEPFCPVMRRWLLSSPSARGSAGGFRNGSPKNPPAEPGAGGKIHPKGTYVCMEGPAFSTKAESIMHRSGGWSGDLIGMTCMPEAKLAREAEIAYALIALPTDYDCWKPHDPGKGQQELLKEIIGNLQAATRRGIELIRSALRDVSILRDHPSPAHDALNLAIWSDKSKIDRAEVEKLRVLWGRYF